MARSKRVHANASHASAAVAAHALPAAPTVMPTAIVLMDTSYCIFYRYYATLNWMRLNGIRRASSPSAPLLPDINEQDSSGEESDINIETLMDNPVFVSMYDKKFEEMLVKIAKQYNTSFEGICLAKDCYRDQIWRMEHFPHYKKNRDDRLKTFNGQIFKHTYQKLLPRLSQKYAFTVLEHERGEADDIIAIGHRILRAKYADLPITIVTNDNDLLQLYDAYTLLVNIPGKELLKRMECSPNHFVKMKILMGDKSDNIPSVFKKCGAKQAMKWIDDPDALAKKLESDPEAAERYALNTLLIDFQQIPEDISNEIEQVLHAKLQWDLSS